MIGLVQRTAVYAGEGALSCDLSHRERKESDCLKSQILHFAYARPNYLEKLQIRMGDPEDSHSALDKIGIESWSDLPLQNRGWLACAGVHGYRWHWAPEINQHYILARPGT